MQLVHASFKRFACAPRREGFAVNLFIVFVMCPIMRTCIRFKGVQGDISDLHAVLRKVGMQEWEGNFVPKLPNRSFVIGVITQEGEVGYLKGYTPPDTRTPVKGEKRAIRIAMSEGLKEANDPHTDFRVLARERDLDRQRHRANKRAAA